MAIKRYLRNKSVEHITIENKDEVIRRLTALVKELTEILATVTGYDREISPSTSYNMYM